MNQLLVVVVPGRKTPQGGAKRKASPAGNGCDSVTVFAGKLF